uniref:Uncharacterized protein n=2 Tax=Lygus hesperus TaxID=30085 RepID=A0A146LEZ3_LYGHE
MKNENRRKIQRTQPHNQKIFSSPPGCASIEKSVYCVARTVGYHTGRRLQCAATAATVAAGACGGCSGVPYMCRTYRSVPSTACAVHRHLRWCMRWCGFWHSSQTIDIWVGGFGRSCNHRADAPTYCNSDYNLVHYDPVSPSSYIQALGPRISIGSYGSECVCRHAATATDAPHPTAATVAAATSTVLRRKKLSKIIYKITKNTQNPDISVVSTQQ